jgi:5-methylcytosine-specific restriction endonuclease McrA
MAQTPEERKAAKAAWQRKWRAENPEKARAWFVENPEKYAASVQAYRASPKYAEAIKRRYQENKDVLLARTQEWRARNRTAVLAYRRAHKKQKPELHRAAQMAREAAKRKAIPGWADLGDVKQVYLEARAFGMEVDHIVPLSSAKVCGLHVWENLQLLPRAENIRKGNRYWPNMP